MSNANASKRPWIIKADGPSRAIMDADGLLVATMAGLGTDGEDAELIVAAVNSFSAPPANLMIENAIDAMEGALAYIVSDYSTHADPNCMNHEIANKLRTSISNLKARP